MYRADAKLPGDLLLALEVGATRVTKADSAVDRLGMRFAPLVLRLMGPRRVDEKRRDRHGGQPRRPDHRPLRGPPRRLRRPRRPPRPDLPLHGQLLLALIPFAFGVSAADVGIWQAVRDRKDVIDRTLPDFLDVLAVVVSAGLGFRQALDRVAEKYEGPWADELRITLRQMDMGVSRRQAFDELRKRNDCEQVAQFVTALQQGEELGAPIVDTLIQIATDMRRTDAQNARRQAAKTIPKATMVTLVFMLPATMILIATGMFLGSGYELRLDSGALRTMRDDGGTKAGEAPR